MAISWLKLDHNIITDIKLRRFSPKEKWAWVVLLCLASQGDDRGIVETDLEDIADLCDYELKDFQYLLDKFKIKGLIEFSSGQIKILKWEKEQHIKPSDRPEATKERKRRQRAKEKEQKPEMSRGVTPLSRMSHTKVTDLSQAGHETDKDKDLDPEEDKDLDPDPKKRSKKSLSQDRAQQEPEPKNQDPNRERDFLENLEPERTENQGVESIDRSELHKFVSERLRPSCKGHIIPYVSSALERNLEYWEDEFRRDRQLRWKNESLLSDSHFVSPPTENSKPVLQNRFAVNFGNEVKASSPAASCDRPDSHSERATRRQNLIRQWDLYPGKREALRAVLEASPHLGLIVEGDRLIDSEIAEVA